MKCAGILFLMDQCKKWCSSSVFVSLNQDAFTGDAKRQELRHLVFWETENKYQNEVFMIKTRTRISASGVIKMWLRGGKWQICSHLNWSLHLFDQFPRNQDIFEDDRVFA